MDTTRKSFGPIIAIAVIVVLIVVAALYFWGAKVATVPAQTSQAGVASVSPADDVSSLQSDLSATDSGPDMSGLDSTQ